jgi:hypothetical protein
MHTQSRLRKIAEARVPTGSHQLSKLDGALNTRLELIPKATLPKRDVPTCSILCTRCRGNCRPMWCADETELGRLKRASTEQ